MFEREIFSKRLAALRTDKGFDQETLALKSGVSKGAIARYETGANTPSLDTACKLADALDCSLDVLAGLIPISGRHLVSAKE